MGAPDRTGRARLAVPLLAATLLLAACGEESLYARLGEQEANEMVALLDEAGLDASKGGNVDGDFSVNVAGGDFARAVAVLQRNGLPRTRYETIGDVFAKEGFVSSPLEERARLNFALSQEIAHTISSIDGVVMARVHLAVPQRDELSDVVAPASASVFVKHRESADLSNSVGEIKALVVNGIENLDYDDVTVVLSRANPRAVPLAATASGGPAAGGTWLLAGLPPLAAPLSLGMLVLVGGLLVWLGWFRGRGGEAGGNERALAPTDDAPPATDSARGGSVRLARRGARGAGDRAAAERAGGSGR